jgi:hypothetical protein
MISNELLLELIVLETLRDLVHHLDHGMQLFVDAFNV